MAEELVSTAAEIDERARRAFEAAWREGRPGPIESYLPAEGHPHREATLEELVQIEMEFAWKAYGGAGLQERAPKLVEDYLARFPKLRQPSVVLRLLRQEDSLRRLRGEAPSREEYQRRFPELCPEGLEFAQPPAAGPAGRRLPEFPGHELLEELGRGAMGVVYKARHRVLGRVVAVKTLPPNLEDDPELVARFVNEAGAVAALQHANIVQIHEVSQCQGRPYFTMEYVEGRTLAQLIRDSAPLPPRDSAALVETVARAVAHAHQRGIVHRDLKPANILLTTGGVPKVSDFGLAKNLQRGTDLTQTGAVVGTPSYMAPEQASGHSHLIGPPADTYALGTILFELLTGRPPFKATTLLETLDLVRSQEPVPPRRLQPGIPRDLETICLKCLRKEPAQRYVQALEMAEDLRRYLNNEPIRARPVGPVGRAMRWCRRQPALAATIAASVAAVLIVASIGLWQVLAERDRYRQQRDRAETERRRAESERDHARENLYRALVGEAEAQLQARPTDWWWKVLGNLREAGQLATADRDRQALRDLALRCMATRYPCFHLHAICKRHAGPVLAVAASGDAKLAASGGSDRLVCVWSAVTGRQLAESSDRLPEVTAVAFQPDGDWLACGDAGGSLRFWNVGGLKAAAEAAQGTVVRMAASRVLTPPGAGVVTAVAFSPDGKWLAAGFQDRLIRIFSVSAADDTSAKRLTGHTGVVNCLAFSPDGSLLASGAEDSTIRYWDVAAAKETRCCAAGNRPTRLAFFPNGESLVTTDRETFGIQVHAVRSKQEFGHGVLHTRPVTSVRVDAKGRLLTASGDGTLKYWSAGERIEELAVAAIEGGEVLAADVSGSAAWVVAGYHDGAVRLWKISEPSQCALLGSSTQSVAFLGASRRLAADTVTFDLARGIRAAGVSFQPPAIGGLAVCPDGRWLAYGNERGDLCLWNLVAKAQAAQWPAHAGPVTALHFSPDGSRLASTGKDGWVKLWAGGDGRPLGKLDAKLGELHALAWSRDGLSLALTGRHGAIIWQTDGKSQPRRLAEHLLPASCIAAGETCVALAGADGSIAVYDLKTGKQMYVLQGHTALVTALEFTPDGKRLASTGRDDTLRFWDTAHGAAGTVIKERVLTASWLAFDPRGRCLAAGGPRMASLLCFPVDRDGLPPQWQACAYAYPGSDGCGRFDTQGTQLLLGTFSGSIRACPVDLARQAFERAGRPEGPVRIDPYEVVVPAGHLTTVWGVAASRDGRWLATASHDTSVKIWDAQTMKLRQTLFGHRCLVWCVAFSPDGNYLASGSAGPVKVWEVATGRLVHDLAGVGPQTLVTYLAFHPRQPWLASSADDGTIRRWDLVSGKQLGVLYRRDGPMHGLAFRGDGRWLAAGGDNRVLLWDLAKPLADLAPPDKVLADHPAPVWSVDFSADGKYLASAGAEGRVVLWDGRTFSPLARLPCGTREMRCVTFSADGGLLAVAGYQSSLFVWDLDATRRTIRELKLDSPPRPE
jgi:WD40 repeat protein